VSKMKRKIIALPLLLVLLAAGGYYYFITLKTQEPADRLQLYGNIDIRQVEVAFYDSGRILTIAVHEGDRVKTGQLLAELDPVRYQAELTRQEAELLLRQQVVAKLERGSRPQEIAEVRARVKALAARVHNARLTYKRLQRLYRKNSIARQRVDDALARYSSLLAEMQAAGQTLDLAVKGPRVEDIAAARAAQQAEQAAVTLARRRLEDTKLYAPADGIIQDRIKEPGDMTFPSTPVLTLAGTNPVWVRAYVPEPDLGKIRPGMKADITTDSFPGKKYKGWIGYISPTAEFTPKNVESPLLRTRLVYQIRVYACNSGGELRLGMPATVSIDLHQPAAATGSGKNVCGR